METNKRYLKVFGNTPIEYSIEKIKFDNYRTSFPVTLSASLLEQFNIFTYELDEPTSATDIPGDFYKDDKGNWRRRQKPGNTAQDILSIDKLYSILYDLDSRLRALEEVPQVSQNTYISKLGDDK